MTLQLMQTSSGWLPNADNGGDNAGLVTTTMTADDADDDASWQPIPPRTQTTTARTSHHHYDHRSNTNLVGFWSVYVYSHCTRINGYTFCFMTENQYLYRSNVVPKSVLRSMKISPI